MKQQVTDIEMVIQPLLTRRRILILREAGVSEDLLDADVYRELRDTKKEYRRLKKENEKQQVLISEKQKQIAEQNKEIQRLQKELAVLNKKLGKLDRPAKTSNNSSVPPSKNPIGIKHTNSLREPSGKPNGGQPGHKGVTLQQTAHPDHSHRCVPGVCPCCGKRVPSENLREGERRQVIDLPKPVFPAVTEYVSMEGVCTCGAHLKGEFPKEATAPVSYGPNIHATVAYLSTLQNLPFKRLKEAMRTLFNVNMSEGTISNILSRMRRYAAKGHEAIRRDILNTKVVGADESGVKINGELYWMWVFQTAVASYFFVDKGRASEIIKTHFPEGFMEQILVTDRLSAYFVIETETHQICLAHLLRNLIYLTLLSPECSWPVEMIELIGEAMKRWKSEGFSQHLYDEFKPRLDELMEQEIKADPPEKQAAIATFRDNLNKKKDYILTFLNTEGVPPDNNASERAIRPVKTKLKVSGQFKTMDGAEAYANLHSIVQTARKNGQDPFFALQTVAKLMGE